MANLVLVQKGQWTKIYCKKISGLDETGPWTNYCNSHEINFGSCCETI